MMGWDHPRSRGEYSPPRPRSGEPEGSSPLSRGILRRGEQPAGFRGIIPALAGNTMRPSGVGGRSGDHPRSRGEYITGGYRNFILPGSSPLSRGIRTSRRPSHHLNRIIPALAGNTGAASRDQAKAWDHPRSRGEYYWPFWSFARRNGSSPLSRGIRIQKDAEKYKIGIIPALAGNTPLRRHRHRNP